MSWIRSWIHQGKLFIETLFELNKNLKFKHSILKCNRETIFFSTIFVIKNINNHFLLQAYTRLIKCSLIIGDTVEAQTAINKLEVLEPSKQSVAAELNDLAKLKRYMHEAEVAYNSKDYRKVSIYLFGI